MFFCLVSSVGQSKNSEYSRGDLLEQLTLSLKVTKREFPFTTSIQNQADK